jgi:hypothetical protein
LKMTKWPNYHTQVINPVPTKVLGCQNETYLHLTEICTSWKPALPGN